MDGNRKHRKFYASVKTTSDSCHFVHSVGRKRYSFYLCQMSTDFARPNCLAKTYLQLNVVTCAYVFASNSSRYVSKKISKKVTCDFDI